MYRGVHVLKLASCTFLPKHVPISEEGAPVVSGGWPAADRGRGAACCYNYTPHSGASSPLLGGSTHTKHSHSVIQYQGVQGTCIPALQPQYFWPNGLYNLWPLTETIGLDQPEPDPPYLEASSLCFTPYLLPLRRFIQVQVDIKR